MTTRAQRIGATAGELVGVVAVWAFIVFVVVAVPLSIVLLFLGRP